MEKIVSNTQMTDDELKFLDNNIKGLTGHICDLFNDKKMEKYWFEILANTVMNMMEIIAQMNDGKDIDGITETFCNYIKDGLKWREEMRKKIMRDRNKNLN